MDLDLIRQIIDNDYQVPSDHDLEILTQSALENLGSPISDQREGSLDILFSWIQKDFFPSSRLIAMGN